MSERYKVTNWHGESGTVYYVVDTFQPEGKQPCVVQSWHTAKEPNADYLAKDFASCRNRDWKMTNGTKREIIEVDGDTAVEGYGIVVAGSYLVEMPDDYDPALVGAEDIILDSSIRIVTDASYVVSGSGSPARDLEKRINRNGGEK